jgi:hypothetical protein
VATTNEKKAVAKVDDTNKQLALPFDMSADAGRGVEGADKDSFAIPFLLVLQKGSPVVDDESVLGAKAGLLMNSITNELFPEVIVVPCGFQRKYVQWGDRDTGGGFKGLHNPVDIDGGAVKTYRDDKGHLRIGDDFLNDTRMHYIMVQSKTGQWFPAVLSLTSTQIKKSKRFMSLIAGIEFKDKNGIPYTPPSFGNTYLLATVKEANDKGSWYGIEITIDEPVTDPLLYAKCKKFNEEVNAGTVKAPEPTTSEDNEAF